MHQLTLPNLIWMGFTCAQADIRYYVEWYRNTCLALIAALLIGGTVAITANWYRTNYTISVTTKNNVAVYTHEDERTTGIINYLTGRGPLPESERLPIYRQYVKNVLEMSKMAVPADFHTRDWDGVNTLAITWCRTKVPNCPTKRVPLQAVINRLFENAIRPPLQEFTANVNDNLWGLLNRVGSPKVRWLEELDEPASRFVVYSAGDAVSFYDPIDNTIYIRYADSVTNLLDEVGHAKQFRDYPFTSYARMGWSMVSALIGGEFDFETARLVYKLRYKNPTTFEGEAHGSLKEELLTESGLLTVDEMVPEKH